MSAAWLAAIAGVRPGPRWTSTPTHPTAIVVIGCTSAGKTTAVDAVRRARLPGVAVPRRYVTRPGRAGDHPDEASVRDPDDFAAAVAAGAIALAWTRALDGGRSVAYGFAPAPPSCLPVYSANNALVDAPAAPVGALVIAIDCPLDLRMARLAARSPDLCRDRPAEIAARLAEPLAPAHALIDNRGDDPAVVGAVLVAVVGAAPR